MESFEFLAPYLALDFLYQFCCDANPYHSLDFLAERYAIDRDAIMDDKKDILDLLSRMGRDFEKQSKPVLDDIKFYFKSIHSNDSRHERLSGFVLLTNANEYLSCSTIDTLKEFLLDLGDDEYNRRFMRALYDYDSNIKNVDAYEKSPLYRQIPDVVDITRYILKMELPETLICRLEDLYFNRESHIERVCMVLNSAVDFIGSYKNELLPLIEDFYNYWGQVQGDRSSYDFLTEDFRVLAQMEDSGYDFLLIPNMRIAEISAAFPSADDSPGDRIILNLGFLFGDKLSQNIMYEVSSPDFPNLTLANVLKLLSDKTRFEIMRYIKTRPAYGSEIAEYMGITTATVSHHMGLLLEANLISLEQKDGKIYYHINKETLNQYINTCEKKLL